MTKTAALENIVERGQRLGITAVDVLGWSTSDMRSILRMVGANFTRRELAEALKRAENSK